MLKLELRAETLARPGYAQLIIRNWNGETSGTTLSIQRNQDQRFLAQDGQWSGSEIQHRLADFQLNGETFWTRLGPEMVDPLLADRQMAYRLTLSDGSTTDRGGLVIASDVMSSMASGSTESPNRVVAAPEPVPEPVNIPEPLPEPDVVVQPEGKPEPAVVPPVVPAKKASLLWLWLLIAILLIAAAIAWFRFKPSAPVASAPAAEVPTAAPAPVGGCSIEAMTSSSELEFVKSCLKTQPNDTQVQEIIKQAKEQKRCDVAQRLYAYKAQSGDIKLALSYAHEYDPETVTSGGCFTADAETAVYWYQTVIAKDPNNADAQARLGALKK
ncbi:hypothetical protein [Rouxiella sp. Mn2063]|uniref:hypothetical protein n=1 Tax=Rouxiella sp. Mn2063 TaxID=3395262 RepID=UPI003BE1D90D